ncbi:MAG: hypothetical protein ACI4S2_17040 [Lachnospiraceae bacterium]
MKKLLSLILAFLMMFTLTSCVDTKAEQTDSSYTVAKKSASKKKEKKDNLDDSSPAQQAVSSSLSSPALSGNWLESRRYSAIDDEYHTVYLRITEIVRNSPEVQSVIDAYNEAEHANSFQPLEQDDLEYCLLKYEVMFPENFPQSESGILFADMDFKIRTPDGEDYKIIGDTPLNLSAVYDISDPLLCDELFAGDTFSNGVAVFIMQKGFSNYIIENNYYIGKECFSCYIKGL